MSGIGRTHWSNRGKKMLPSKLRSLKDALIAKGHRRSRDEDRLLKELEELETNTPENVLEHIEKRANASYPVYGPTGDVCPTCGNPW